MSTIWRASRSRCRPLHEQDKIVAFLDAETAKIDALIGKQEQLIATLREDRTATITHAVTKGLDPDVEMKDRASSGSVTFQSTGHVREQLKRLACQSPRVTAQCASRSEDVGTLSKRAARPISGLDLTNSTSTSSVDDGHYLERMRAS